MQADAGLGSAPSSDSTPSAAAHVLRIKRPVAEPTPELGVSPAPSGEGLLLRTLQRDWLDPSAESLRAQAAEAWGYAAQEVGVSVCLRWQAVDPALANLLEAAARTRLSVDLKFDEQVAETAADFGVSFIAAGCEPTNAWSNKLTQVHIRYPKISDSFMTQYRSNFGLGLARMLNEYCASQLDQSANGSVPLFCALGDDFVPLEWSAQELDQGVRLSRDFAVALREDGAHEVVLLSSGTSLPAVLVPGLEQRDISDSARVLVQFRLPLPQAVLALAIHPEPKQPTLIDQIAQAFTGCGLKFPAELRAQLLSRLKHAEFSMDAGAGLSAQELGQQAERRAELDQRRVAAGLPTMKNLVASGIPSSPAECMRRQTEFRNLRQQIFADDDPEFLKVKAQVLPLLAQIAKKVEHGQPIEARIDERLKELLPASHYRVLSGMISVASAAEADIGSKLGALRDAVKDDTELLPGNRAEALTIIAHLRATTGVTTSGPVEHEAVDSLRRLLSEKYHKQLDGLTL